MHSFGDGRFPSEAYDVRRGDISHDDHDREHLGIRPELTQRFIVADGRQLERQLGIAIVHAAGAKAPDFIVFAEPDDMVILGARSLEGLNVRVDAQRKQLVPAGPILAGLASA